MASGRVASASEMTRDVRLVGRRTGLPRKSPRREQLWARLCRTSTIVTVQDLSYVPVADAMRGAVTSYYDGIGRPLRGASGLATLETHAGLAPVRARLLLTVIARQGGGDNVAGLRVAEVGAGFGALALWFAAHGAVVTAIEPNAGRSAVGEAVASEHGLQLRWMTAPAQAVALPPASQDIVIMNNAFCYLVGREARALALSGLLRATRPGGHLVVRDPNRLRLVDPFCGLPLVHLFGPDVARRAATRMGRRRSEVRLVTRGALRRELRRAAWIDARAHPTGTGVLRRALGVFTPHIHVAASRRHEVPGATAQGVICHYPTRSIQARSNRYTPG
jgi:SAM-dependent methyltransferase